MSISGLKYILEKEEIVATQRAEDLLLRPDSVNQSYKKHVRTYLPLGRQAIEGQSVNEFERRVISEVRRGGAVRGYITAEYGYGKTSTALYLWDCASKSNILTVPPFQLNNLIDLIIASYGWIKYEVGRKKPNLVVELESLYNSLINRTAESLAEKYEINTRNAKRMVRDRPDLLELSPTDYIEYFERMTSLAKIAGYDGLIIIADEVQQYIEPEIKSGTKDPISPLFDVIGAILTRQNFLEFGLILVIPPKELALLRDQRGDLVHRLLKVSLDLNSVYNREFPKNLWDLLTEEFKFKDHKYRIVSEDTLEALGQISCRGDLSDGPRTVINAFKRMTQRYVDLNQPENNSYSPYDLINDFLDGKIQFDSPKKISRFVKQALSHNMVKGNEDREKAVIWAAAYPNEGITRSMQQNLGLTSAYDDLAQSTLGDLIISVGDIHNSGFTLRGLDQVLVETDWLTTTIREFYRTYIENSDIIRERAIKAFLSLLTKKVFPENQWSIIDNIESGLTRNAGLILEGSFTSYSRIYPERTLHIRVLWENEPIKDTSGKCDLVIIFRLFCYFDLPEDERRQLSEKLNIDFNAKQIEVNLNLKYQGNFDAISPTLNNIVGPIVSPYQLTPLLLLTMYQFLEEKRERKLIPKIDDQQLEYGFQPDLLDNIFRNLFNKEVGETVEAAEERIIELSIFKLLKFIYPDYDTLIHINNWSSSLQKYKNALKQLETNHERQGQIIYEGLKNEIADLFTLSNTGLDSFINNFPSLIEITRDFPTKQEAEQGIRAAIRFRMHDLEQSIKNLLKEATEVEQIKVADQLLEVHCVPINEIYNYAKKFGYLQKETDAIIDLLEERGLIEIDLRRGILREAISKAPSVDELLTEVDVWIKEIDILLSGFSDSNQLKKQYDQAKGAKQIIEERFRVKPDDEQLISLKKSVKVYRGQLFDFSKEKHSKLINDVTTLLTHLPGRDNRLEERLKSPVKGSVDYVQQVNDLRVRLLRNYTRLVTEMQALEKSIQCSEVMLKKENLSFNKIVELSDDVKSHDHESKELKEKSNAFSESFTDYAAWVNLVNIGSEILDEIQTLGNLVKEQRLEFENLCKEMNGYLSSNKLAALPDATTYGMRLNEVSTSVRRIKNEAISHFNDLQERYQLSLVNILGFPRDRLWALHVYNPLAPDDSYNRLFHEVKTTLDNIHNQMSHVISSQRESINSTLQSPLLSALQFEERESIMIMGKELNEELGSLNNELVSLHDSLEIDQIADLPEDKENSQFNSFLEKYKLIRNRLSDIHPNIERINRVLQELKLTPLEEKLLQVFPADRALLEVSEFQHFANEFPNNDLWVALRGLHAKRRLRISIELVRHD